MMAVQREGREGNRVQFAAYTGVGVTTSLATGGFQKRYGLSFRLVKPSQLFSGLGMVKGAGATGNAAGLAITRSPRRREREARARQ